MPSDCKRLSIHSLSPSGLAGLLVCLPSTQVDGRSRFGLDGEALILLFPLEVRRQLNSMPATLMGRSRMIYDIEGYVKKIYQKKMIVTVTF